MKKFLLTFAALAFGFAAQAQSTIYFTETIAKGELNNKEFTSSDEVLSITVIDNGVSDGKPNPKMEVDANSQYFDSPDGTFANALNLKYRLKTGGKSDSKHLFNCNVTKKGTLYIYARSASSSATDRNIIVTQNEVKALDVIVKDENSILSTDLEGDSPKTIFTSYSAKLEAGDFTITFPVNSINFYGFKFVADSEETTPTAVSNISAEKSAKVFKTVENGQMIIVKNGVKYNVLGQIVK